jgi:hypothetical protein
MGVPKIKEVAAAITGKNKDYDNDEFLDRKITLATDWFTTKFCELTLRDRTRLSKENALMAADYIIAMKREVNPRLNYIRSTVQFL